MASVSHSTGARSSVQGSSAGARGRICADRSLVKGCSGAGTPRVGEAAAQLGERRRRRQAHDELVEAQRLPGHDLGELGRQRAGDAVRETGIAGDGRDVEGDDAAGREAAAAQGEELPCREVEGDVGLAVGVDHDQVVAAPRGLQEGTGVGCVHTQARVVAEAEVAPGHRRHLRVELDPVVGDAGVEDAEGARRGARGVAQHHGARRSATQQGGQGQEHVPFAAGEHGAGPPHRVHGVALVQVQVAHQVAMRGRALLDHLDELVARLALVDDAGLRLDEARRQRQQQRQRDRRGEPAPAQQHGAGDGDHGGRAEQGALGAHERDRDEGRHEGAEQAAGGREREDAAGGGAGRVHPGHRQPDGERRHHAEQHDRRREEQQ